MKRAIFILCFAPILFFGCESGKSNKLGQGGASGGDLKGYNCASIHRCVKHCGPDKACQAGCVDDGSVDGAKRYLNLTSCIGYNCMFLSEEETADCINEVCANELWFCGLNDAEAGDFEPSAPGSDVGDSAADSGNSAADSGDSGSDSGNSGSDSGNSGDSGADSGDSGSDSGDSAADSGDSAADSGSTGGDTGSTGGDTGGSTGGDTGDSAGDSGDSTADSGDSAVLEFCGDGIKNGSEFCDDGEFNGKYGRCKSDCSGLGDFCGDGIKNGSEFCDDGEFNGKYGHCKSDCTGLGEYCGDGVKNGPEFCDDGENNGKYGYCRADCSGEGEHCGDGAINGDEICDDGENNGKYGYCRADCGGMGEYCGDGAINGGEICDDGELNGEYGRCKSDCSGMDDSGDTGDTGDSGDSGDSGSGLPACGKGSATPCLDSTTNLTWSAKASSTMKWNDAKTHCNNLTEGGFSDWRLPSISELRTLIRNCPATVTGGSCNIVDGGCLSTSCRDPSCANACTNNNTGKYSLFGDTSWFWSSSPVADNPDYAWGVNFVGGYVHHYDIYSSHYVRCVR